MSCKPKKIDERAKLIKELLSNYDKMDEDRQYEFFMIPWSFLLPKTTRWIRNSSMNVRDEYEEEPLKAMGGNITPRKFKGTHIIGEIWSIDGAHEVGDLDVDLMKIPIVELRTLVRRSKRYLDVNPYAKKYR